MLSRESKNDEKWEAAKYQSGGTQDARNAETLVCKVEKYYMTAFRKRWSIDSKPEKSLRVEL